MSSSSTSQEQYERKLARQKQLDMMEAAAAGQSVDDAGSVASSSVRSRSSISSSAPPDGAIESARRFLWDEEEDGGAMPSAVTLDHMGGVTGTGTGDQAAGLMTGDAPSFSSGFGSRMANTIMGSFFSGKESELATTKNTQNLAPRRVSTFDAQPREADEFISSKDRRSNGAGICSALCNGCMAVVHLIVGAFAVVCEYMTACLANMNPRLCCMIVGALTGVGFFIFAIVAIVHRVNDNTGSHSASSSPSSSNVPEIKDAVRYGHIRDAIIASAFTTPDTVDTVGTAQNYALRWLTDEDRGQVAVDDDALLQRYALATFYFSTYVYSEVMDAQNNANNEGAATSSGVGGGWKYMDYWMSEKGICNWFGVSCPPHLREGIEEVHYNANANVLYLNLTDNNMRGFIPSELAALENLISLDLGNNQLSGTVPKSFGTYKAMTELYLEDNIMSGTIPSELGDVTTMRDFFLGTNKFVGTIPTELTFLTDLRAFGVDENLLTGSIPEALWSSCTKLVILYLDSNSFTGTLSPDMGKLTYLEDVRLRKNALTGTIPPEISALTHLELFYVDDNKLMGSIPATSWQTMQRLQEIQLYKNQLTGVLPESIQELAKLKVLYVDNNKLQGTLPASYGNLGDLRVFYTFNNQMEGSLPTEFGNLNDMVDLQVYNNQLTGSIPSELANCYKLQKFEAQDNKLTGTIPSEIGMLENLELLKLYRNLLTGSVPRQVCDAKDQYQLGFLATDCSTGVAAGGGKVQCDCCNACYP